MKTQLFTPDIDTVIGGINRRTDFINRDIYDKLVKIYSVLSCLEPIGDDELREIWLEVERGSIEVFGDFEEYKESGEVETRDDFEQLWKAYHPDETKWYKFQTAKYQDDLYTYLEGKPIGSVNVKAKPSDSDKPGWNLSYYEQFFGWLLEKTIDETKSIKENLNVYNSYILKNLPWSKRYGRIRRKDFWEIMGTEIIRPDINLGEELVTKLKRALDEIKENQVSHIPRMTANKFFRICEICYEANSYFKNSGKVLSPRDKYLIMADGRDAGLRDIEGDLPGEFNNWYHSGENIGAHPWEICRGGNSTHISLQVYDKNGQWILNLAGSSIVRVEETVRMAVALYENNILFELRDAEEIVRMVSGTDYIGIVPDTVFPRYCHSLFPKEDRIIDFMNLGSDKDIVPAIVGKTYWYPLEKTELA